MFPCEFCEISKNTFFTEHSWTTAANSHRKRKDSLETRAALLIFLLELEMSGVAVQRIHQNSANWWLCKELLSENNFKAVLATFCCYGYGAYASEAVRYRSKRLSQILFVCYSLLNS